jgi:hypothetical protein
MGGRNSALRCPNHPGICVNGADSNVAISFMHAYAAPMTRGREPIDDLIDAHVWMWRKAKKRKETPGQAAVSDLGLTHGLATAENARARPRRVPRREYMDNAYIAIGRAVFTVQMFEATIIPLFAFHRMSNEPGYLENTAAFIPEGRWKKAVSELVKDLATETAIAEDFQQRLNAFIEDRHRLTHRLFREFGLPLQDDGFAPIIELANKVEIEAKKLAGMLAGYIVKYRHPDRSAVNPNEFHARMTDIFNRAHLDG